MSRIESVREVTIDRYGDSEFLEAITDKNPEDIWMVMDELMSTLQALNPRLYEATMDRLKR
jgi:GGDEF domain-containing protein